MKLLLLAVFVVAAAAVPLPDDGVEPVEMIVNGVPDGVPLEISDVLEIKLKEHLDGNVVSATNLLHPFTAVGIAEAAIAAEAAAAAEGNPSDVVPEIVTPDIVVPEAIVLPEPATPEVSIPEAIVLPEPAVPEVVVPEVILPEMVIPEAVVLPEPVAPEVVPDPVAPEVDLEPVILPEPIAPEVVETPEDLPVPAPQFPDGELYNDGGVQVTVNGPESGIMSTLQSWFNMVVNYFSDGVQQSSQQIV